GTAHSTPYTPRTRSSWVSVIGSISSTYSTRGSMTQMSASLASRIWLAVRNIRPEKIATWFDISIVEKAMPKIMGGREPTSAVVTELVPLGSFATWQAERAVGDHDRNTLRPAPRSARRFKRLRARDDGVA